jgi:hypothetical protein
MFLAQEVMNALKVVYLQYWLKFSCEETLLMHLALSKGFYC